ncbi:uncharacterized protein LOC109847855 [Asparagus officinalis]|uniref:uncharacterized protein LOC109847855 n=1 Tax=Asparagus officinalis TaxID=4686 RepID=UPI00098E4D05|nr:uncharacterized protein LOC109847855 [Asparagus officinalis]
MKRSFFDYFSNLFNSQSESRLNVDWQSLYPEGNTDLSSLNIPFSPEEIKYAVFELHPDKSTGLDANRLSKFLHLLVDGSQSAFQKGKSTLDSILITHEMINFCSSSKKEICAIKVDFFKAFDCVNWSFLLSLIEARGFSPRGLKQGDPLSPMLFLLVVDVLNRMLINSAAAGDLSQLNLKGELNKIRSLQFADDTTIFSKALPTDMITLKAILLIFANISGLRVNHIKSNLFYLGKFPHKGPQLANLLNCSVGSLPFSYLGLPLKFGSLSKRDWQPLLDSFSKKLSLWKSRSLSLGGRLTLLNSVPSSIPLCYSSFFKLPRWLIKAIDKIRRNFLWNDNHQSSIVRNLVSWDTVCRQKKDGGLGVIQLESFNIALLSKWIWKFFDRESLVSKVVFSLYSKDGANLVAHIPTSHASKLIKDLHSIHRIFFSFARWNIGDGRACMFWIDKWTRGQFSVKSLYSALTSGGINSVLYNFIWISPIPLKVKTFFWIVSKHRLNTRANLVSKGWSGDPRCPFCSLCIEDLDHLFIKCPFAISVWSALLPNNNPASWHHHLDDLILFKDNHGHSNDIKQVWKVLLPCCCWWIWNSRNYLIFKDKLPNPDKLAANIARYTLLWTGAEEDRLARRIQKAAIKLKFEEIARRKVEDDVGDNFPQD